MSNDGVGPGLYYKILVSSVKTLPVFLVLTLLVSAVMISIEVIQGDGMRIQEMGLLVFGMSMLIIPLFVTVIAAIHSALEVEDLA